MKKKKGQIRAVIDTNLFVSGLFAYRGAPCQLQELWLKGAFELVVSKEILREVRNTLLKPAIEKKLNFDKEAIDMVIGLIREKALIITDDLYETDKIKKDDSDNKFLGCALETNTDFIVTGDNHLLEIKHFYGIQIVDASTFVKKIKDV